MQIYEGSFLIFGGSFWAFLERIRPEPPCIFFTDVGLNLYTLYWCFKSAILFQMYLSMCIQYDYMCSTCQEMVNMYIVVLTSTPEMGPFCVQCTSQYVNTCQECEQGHYSVTVQLSLGHIKVANFEGRPSCL